jgi:Tfp pilus assembly protein PilV
MKTDKTKRGEGTAATSAFTLAEVMVAVLLMLLMALALYAGFTQGFAIVRLSQENLRATQLLVRQMENIRLYTWSQITNTQYLPRSFTTSYDPTSVGGNTGTVYHVKIDAPTVPPASSGLPDGYRTNMYLINVTVYWTNVVGSNNIIVRSRSMQTYVAQYGIQKYVGY